MIFRLRLLRGFLHANINNRSTLAFTCDAPEEFYTSEPSHNSGPIYEDQVHRKVVWEEDVHE